MNRHLLPQGWEWKRLGEVCDINPRDRLSPDLADETPVAFVPMPAVSENGMIKAPKVRPLKAVKRGYTRFKDGDVLFAKITPCMENGKTAVARRLCNGLGFGSTEFHILRPRERVIADWVHLFIRQQGFRDEAKASMRGGVGQQRVPEEFLSEHEIPIPPLEEQRRIVARIEELTRRIEEAKGLRRAACDEAASLLPTALYEVFGRAEQEGWEWKRLGELVARTKTKDPSRMPEDEFMYVDIASVDSTSGNITTPKILKGKDAPSRARKVIRVNDVIFATTRPYLKSIALVPANLDNQICSTGFCVLRAVSSQVLSSWLFHLCRSDMVLNQVVPRMRGANYPAVTDKDVLDAEIPVPPLDEQRRIVAYLDGLQAKVEALRRLQDETQAELDAMAAAVLGKAFQGEL